MRSRSTLSIIIPAYNETGRLLATLGEIERYINLGLWAEVEVIIVDDGSIDDTVAVAISAKPRFASLVILNNPVNKGKGFSVKRGMLSACGDWRLFTDADLSTPIEELNKLYKASSDGSDIVIGSRAIDTSLIQVHQSTAREVAGKVFNFVMRRVSNLAIHDTQCGFKLYKGDAAQRVFSQVTVNGFGFDVEALYIGVILGLRIAEIPVVWRNAAGSKVSLATGFKPFLDLVTIRFNHLLGRYK